ncbi:NADPH-dependent F420 reductase [Hyunsoonleella sp. SJ7]|uniref:NADPH-dependent F420 reductase n=2 Tax=Hyunsoonleella aquatilis TaxID=2762758 RepID=A0A923HDX9_9FLAO|nr:NADPH-dependent F420 reductase [Hyunsoonleella aquatilis]
MTLAFIGIGNVGFSLANNLEKNGYEIIVAHNDIKSETVKGALSKNPNFKVDSIQNAIDKADIVFLATPFSANESILKLLDFKGKILVDCTNPVGPGISHGLKSTISGAEKVQELAPSAKVIKAFTIYGFENFKNSEYPNYNVKPVMLVAGNDSTSKSKLKPLVNDLGFQMKDTGNLDQALHLEHMTLLWVKMVRRDGHRPNFVWGYLER